MSPKEHGSAAVVLLADGGRSGEESASANPRDLPLFNRDLSWLAFNRRVVAEAENSDVPLLERIKFLSIAAANLDEFFMIRVGEIRDLIAANLAAEPCDSRQQLDALRHRSRRLLEQMYRCLTDELLPRLRKEGIRVDRVADLGKKDRVAVEERFTRDLEPILTPLAIDPGHPFPFVANLSLNLALLLESKRGEEYFVVLKIPESVPRLMSIDKRRFLLLEDVISAHVERFFPGLRLRNSVPFRVIRNSDISIKEDDVQDLLKSVESELRRRERREVVWLEIEGAPDEALVEMLRESIPCREKDVFFAPGSLKLADLMQIYDQVKEPRLTDCPFNPRIAAQLATKEDIFSIIRRGDLLLHRPYDSFATVIELVQTAAEDPNVKAIKLTLYRTEVGSVIIDALATAASLGKQVTAVVELQARFDEKKNITWARRLEEAGVQVVYGLVGIKTHCKVCLVVRREGDELRRYVHLSTGNYNTVTARIYTDIDFFTCDPEFGADAAKLMNLLTGFSVTSVQELLDSKETSFNWRRLVVAPIDYQRWVVEMIEREIRNARDEKPARITAKLNAISDPMIIGALYRASRAGVGIQLLVRGICCLVPGIGGVSENIDVISVVDRFLEHTRIFRFENGGNPEIYISSGDWMPRNFLHRIEVTFPVRNEAITRRLEQILSISLADNVKSWLLRSDGKYERRKTEGAPVRSQEAFISIARAEAIRLGPYEEIMLKPGPFRKKAKKKRK